MGTQRILILLGGTLGMLIVMLLRRKTYPQVQPWKFIPLSILLTICGVLGAMLMFFIEQGHFSGTSFFGAILFIPILMFISIPLRIPYLTIMDLCAPAECLMLAFMKVDCLLSGCCFGRYMPALNFQFPSQIVELVNALLIMGALIRIEQKTKIKGTIYGWYLLFYGISRFILNWFRYGITPIFLGLPFGNLWSLLSIVSGIIWILQATYVSKKNDD